MSLRGREMAMRQVLRRWHSTTLDKRGELVSGIMSIATHRPPEPLVAALACSSSHAPVSMIRAPAQFGRTRTTRLLIRCRLRVHHLAIYLLYPSYLMTFVPCYIKAPNIYTRCLHIIRMGGWVYVRCTFVSTAVQPSIHSPEQSKRGSEKRIDSDVTHTHPRKA
ncbi:hypothetical protein LY78DRAFT_372989 [Colletotrichum sublineola]|nr:hypothetical protein LY78DRAFT_372989 [Colletotrichum sublineola]